LYLKDTVTKYSALYNAGAVKLVGFDAGAQSVEALKAGRVHALIVQNPVRMGYQGVMSAVQNLQGKPVERRINTGVTLVTKENMDLPIINEWLNPPLNQYLAE
jgi:ribose transport system substrate-binding protein